MSDEPIIPHSREHSSVIDLADIRISIGSAKKRNFCNHKRLTYCLHEERVWCSDCEKTIDGFDAFKILASNFYQMEAEMQRKQRELDKALQSQVRRIAAKHIEKAWNGNNAVMCPHCSKGLIAEDFQAGGSQCSKEIEMKRREKDGGR